MLKVVPDSAAVDLHDPDVAVQDFEYHARKASHLARMFFQLTRSVDVDFSDQRDRDALDTLADELATHASAVEHLLDAPKR